MTNLGWNLIIDPRFELFQGIDRTMQNAHDPLVQTTKQSTNIDEIHVMLSIQKECD